MRRVLARRTGVYYGWFVVGACFLAVFSAFGISYSFGVFLDAILEAFGLPRGITSLVFSLQTFSLFVTAALVGPLVRRYGVRTLLAAGTVLFAGGLVGASASRSIAALLVSYGVVTGAGMGVLFIIGFATVPRWFGRRRGLAMGLTTTGLGFGMVVVPPAATYLIGLWDWRVAFFVLVGALLVGLAAAVAVVADGPAALGVDAGAEFPDGATGAAEPVDLGAIRSTVRSPAFLSVFLGWILVFSTLYVLFSHLVVHVTDIGLDRWVGAWALSVIGVTGIASRLAIGTLSDRVGVVVPFVACSVVMASVPLLLPLARTEPAVLALAGLFGIGYGGADALLSPLAAELFGTTDLYSVFGLMSVAFAVSGLGFPYLAGLAFDVRGSYLGVFLGVGALALVGAGLVALGGHTKGKLRLAGDAAPSE